MSSSSISFQDLGLGLSRYNLTTIVAKSSLSKSDVFFKKDTQKSLSLEVSLPKLLLSHGCDSNFKKFLNLSILTEYLEETLLPEENFTVSFLYGVNQWLS